MKLCTTIWCTPHEDADESRTQFCCKYIVEALYLIWGRLAPLKEIRARQMLPYCSHRSSWCLPYFIRRTSTMRPALPRSRSSTWCVSSHSLLEKPGAIDHMHGLDKWLIRSRLRISLTVLIPHTIFISGHCCQRQLLLIEQRHVKERIIKLRDATSDTNPGLNCKCTLQGEARFSVKRLWLPDFDVFTAL